MDFLMAARTKSHDVAPLVDAALGAGNESVGVRWYAAVAAKLTGLIANHRQEVATAPVPIERRLNEFLVMVSAIATSTMGLIAAWYGTKTLGTIFLAILVPARPATFCQTALIRNWLTAINTGSASASFCGQSYRSNSTIHTEIADLPLGLTTARAWILVVALLHSKNPFRVLDNPSISLG